MAKKKKSIWEEYKKEFAKVLDVIRGFFIIVKDNQIVITNEDNIEVILGEWKDTYFYHSMISGYYNANQLDNEQEKDAGIYLIIETGENGPSSGVEYYFNVDTHNTKKFDLPEIGAVHFVVGSPCLLQIILVRLLHAGRYQNHFLGRRG